MASALDTSRPHTGIKIEWRLWVTESADFSPDRISLEHHQPLRIVNPEPLDPCARTGAAAFFAGVVEIDGNLSAGEILKQMLERLRVRPFPRHRRGALSGLSVIPRLRILAKRRKLYFDFLHLLSDDSFVIV